MSPAGFGPATGRPGWWDDLLAAARDAGEDVDSGLRLAETYGRHLPIPGRGQTELRWGALAAVAAADLTAARVLEAHCDALAILAEDGQPQPGGTWGVFAAEAAGSRLEARLAGETWTLQGTKAWCSLGAVLDHALVTAHTHADRQLFAVDLRRPEVRAEPADGWVSRGLRNVPSGPVHFDSAPARPVGDPAWYLTRPGFAWGGIGVAACWYGGARALGDALARATAGRGGELAALSLGTVDVALHAAAVSLADAARGIDAGHAGGGVGQTLALRVRAVVAAAVERTLEQVGHALGPAPLAFDEVYARRVADLGVYVRQHHAERDLAVLGRRLIDGSDT